MWAQYGSDVLFKSWVDQNNLKRAIYNIYKQQNTEAAKRVLESYRTSNEKMQEYALKTVFAILDEHPEIAQRHAQQIEELRKYGMRDSAVFNEVIPYLSDQHNGN